MCALLQLQVIYFNIIIVNISIKS